MIALRALVFTAALSLLAGCLSRPPVQREYFLLAPPPPPPSPATNSADILSLRTVTVASPFAGRSLTYQISTNGYEFDPYAEFVVPPDQMLGNTLRSWLRQEGLFRDVTEPESQARPTRVAEVHVAAFHGDFRQPSDPAAIVSLRFVLFARATAGTAGGGDVALARLYTRRVRLRDRTAAGVVQGLQQALNEALTELKGDLAKVK